MDTEPTKNDIASYRTRDERSRLLDEVHNYLNDIPNGDLDVAKRALTTIRGAALNLNLRYAAGRFYVLQPDGLWEMDDEQDNATTTLLQRWAEAECNELDVLDKQLRAAWAANEAAGGDESWNESYGKARDRFKDTRKYWRGRVQSRQSRKNILEDMRGLPGVRVPDGPDAFDADPDVLAVANGLLDLRTGKLRGLRASDMVTQRLKVAYRPDAAAPMWQEFLEQVILDEAGQPDADLIAWLQRLVGYAITGHASEQVFVLLTGKGANGKGVLTRALRTVLGAITKAAQVETFEQARAGSGASGDLARLNGARLVLASEPETGARFKAGLIKQITGGDPVTARHLYRPEFEFMPKFVVLISTNSLPTAIDASDGLEVTGDPADRVPRTEVWLSYVQWADDVKTEPMRDQTFYSAMTERPGVRAVKSSGIRMLAGVKVLDGAAVKAREVAAAKELRGLRAV